MYEVKWLAQDHTTGRERSQDEYAGDCRAPTQPHDMLSLSYWNFGVIYVLVMSALEENVISLSLSHRALPWRLLLVRVDLWPKLAQPDQRKGLICHGQWRWFPSCALHPDINETIYRTHCYWQPSNNHLGNQPGMRQTQGRAELGDRKNLGLQWHLELLVFAWPGAIHLWVPSYVR